MTKRWIGAALGLLLLAHPAQAGSVNRSTKSANGTTSYGDGENLLAAELNEDFDNIYTEFNGGIDSDNIQNDTILNADINSAAAIAWSKLSVSSTDILTEKVDNHSANAAEQDDVTDPGTTASPSLAADLSVELENLRYAIKRLAQGTSITSSSQTWIDPPARGPNLLYNGDFEAAAGTGSLTNDDCTACDDTAVPGTGLFGGGWLANGTPNVNFQASTDDDYGDGTEIVVTGAGAANEGIEQVLTNLAQSTVYLVVARAKSDGTDRCEIVTTGAATNIATGDAQTQSASWVTLADVFTTAAALDTVTVQFNSVADTDVCAWDKVGVYALKPDLHTGETVYYVDEDTTSTTADGVLVTVDVHVPGPGYAVEIHAGSTLRCTTAGHDVKLSIRQDTIAKRTGAFEASLSGSVSMVFVDAPAAVGDSTWDLYFEENGASCDTDPGFGDPDEWIHVKLVPVGVSP